MYGNVLAWDSVGYAPLHICPAGGVKRKARFMNKVPTGVSGLDELLTGGLPRPSAIAIVGEVGSGKSVLCRQIAWNLLRRGFHILYYTTDESMDDVKQEMLDFGWDIEQYEKKNTIRFIDLFSKATQTLADFTERGTPEDALNGSYDFKFLVTEGKNYYYKAMGGKELAVVFDSITALFMNWDSKTVLRFLQTLKFATRVAKAIGIGTLHSKVHGVELENACKHIADGVIELTTTCPLPVKLGQKARYVRVLKMIKTRTQEDYRLAELTSKGLVIAPSRELPAGSETLR